MLSMEKVFHEWDAIQMPNGNGAAILTDRDIHHTSLVTSLMCAIAKEP